MAAGRRDNTQLDDEAANVNRTANTMHRTSLSTNTAGQQAGPRAAAARLAPFHLATRSGPSDQHQWKSEKLLTRSKRSEVSGVDVDDLVGRGELLAGTPAACFRIIPCPVGSPGARRYHGKERSRERATAAGEQTVIHGDRHCGSSPCQRQLLWIRVAAQRRYKEPSYGLGSAEFCYKTYPGGNTSI
ncbi:unnamed protein product [Gadus morhua 'NCC']